MNLKMQFHLTRLEYDDFTTNGEATWDTTTMVSSDTQTNFATQGYVVPRDGVYKIDCYQTIRGKTTTIRSRHYECAKP